MDQRTLRKKSARQTIPGNPHSPHDAGLLSELGRIDHVTRLPNRLQFIEQFASLARAEEPRMLLLVTLADARHYNEILRALGMAFSEDFVRAGVALLASLLPNDTTIYHVSVLSFVVALPADTPDQPPAAVAAMAKAFTSPIIVDTIPIKAHVGMGLVPFSLQRGAAESLRAALVAAQDSRNSIDGFAFYNHKSDAAHLRAFKLLTDLPRAMAANDQLMLHYQPRISLQTNHCHGAEALLRWNHPELGAVAPAEFIHLAEQTALIVPLTEWVMRQAITQNRQFLDAGHALRMSINASPANLSEVGFDEAFLHCCDAARLDPEYMELEFTEGMLANDSVCAVEQLGRLREAGVDVALDDFGSGYSNLSYISHIPADVLKIDQSFVRPLKEPGDEDFLLRQIISMAQGLGFRVCAEGVETAYAYERLRELGCQEAQGYFMARPMPARALLDWLEAGGDWAAMPTESAVQGALH